ncbi:hypothetical protein [Rhizobium leguminosarum]|uniref:hypothetical protein n=1 Tax=Rhizobium leguminosarum TaxID=384 RepID=UPI001C950BD0|nr:hypothetical protein [Rhizobium leguminosarum]MBY5606583.1 hypothetical protein [Rhizobium leguminosarum]MBY5653407.1 hypothetical protein [Rhizobium leguminosarum]
MVVGDCELYSARAIARGKNFRSLFTVHEQKQGDVYIRLISGLNSGMNDVDTISEHRYSIHVSPKSKDYNVIKRTLTAKDKSSLTSVALTNAVKARTGFTHIVSQSFTDLTDRIYDRPEDGKLILPLNTFDQRKQTFMLSLFVGYPDAIFPKTYPELITIFHTKFFQFVICSDVLDFPSTFFGRTIDSATFRPEDFENERDQAHARRLMEGYGPERCIALARSLHKWMHIGVLEILLVNAPDREAQLLYQSLIKQRLWEQEQYDRKNDILPGYINMHQDLRVDLPLAPDR